MSVVSVKCLLMGHEDLRRTREKRMFLACSHCGRETHGWDLVADDRGATSTAQANPHSVLA